MLACYLYVDCVWFHANRIESAKKEDMQTAEERQDWSADTGRVFLPVFAIGASIVYCAVNLIAAGVSGLVIDHIRRIPRQGRILKRDPIALRGEQ